LSLPGLNPTLASVALATLMRQWLEAMGTLPESQTSNQATDRLILAVLLLAQENADLVRGTCREELDQCLMVARSGSWAVYDEIPWLVLQGYLTTGKAASTIISRVEGMLGHDSSGAREWFHYVAWMIRSELDLSIVRPMLLQNLADKLGAVELSAGLLAALHPEKNVLDEAADIFHPPEGFLSQYQSRVEQVRDQQWNFYALTFWLADNLCRKLIWDAVKSTDVRVLPPSTNT